MAATASVKKSGIIKYSVCSLKQCGIT